MNEKVLLGVSIVALLLSSISLVQVNQLLPAVREDIADATAGAAVLKASIESDIKGLKDTVQLYGDALGVGSPQEAEKIVQAKKEHLALIEAARKEGTVVFFTAKPLLEDAESIFAAFNKKYPFIEAQWQYIASRSLVERVQSEDRAGRPSVDVIWLNQPWVHALQEKGLIASYKSPEAAIYPETYKHPDGLWTITDGLPSVIAYNTELVSKEDAPKTWEDLLDPKWKGKLFFEDPLTGSAYTSVYAAFKPILGVDYYYSLSQQNPVLSKGMSATLQRLAAGEVPATAYTFGTHAQRSVEKEMPIDWVVPDPVHMLTDYLFTLEDSPHPNAARLLIDFILSKEGQTIHAKYYLSIRPDIVLTPQEHPRTLAILDKLNRANPTIVITPEELVPKMAELREELTQIFVEKKKLDGTPLG